MNHHGVWGGGLLTVAVVFLSTHGEAAVALTKHNLSVSGPGPVRSLETSEVCVFCHTPHNASPARPLWNRELPGVTYRLYESRTLKAALNQPTGSSRLCLSCHDGTIALGALRRPPRGSPISLGPLTGRASLGTDLSDDHPVSFLYDSLLAARRGELVDPPGLPAAVRRDETQQMQCTTCHNVHDDRFGKFLVMENRFSALCTTCHRKQDWPTSSHATSPATWTGSGTTPWPHTPYTTVAENGCENCHRPHAAGLPPRLLTYPREEDTCLVCHNGSVATRNIAAQFAKFSIHPIQSTERVHDPTEDPFTMPRHVECQDCHNPHVVTGASSSPPLVSGRLRRVQGISASGARVSEATYEYEVCFTCHGIQERSAPVVLRNDSVSNVRLEFDTLNPSFHPVEAVGRNGSVPSLRPPYTTSSLIFCTDCHSSDSPTTGGRGPHGSAIAPILTRDYSLLGSRVSESSTTYALCYTCHDRTSLLNNVSRFPHRLHVAEVGASCAICHDAHGSRGSAHLVNFMTRDRAGATVVTPSRDGRLEFQDQGEFRGQCYLRCHGKDHNPEEYR